MNETVALLSACLKAMEVDRDQLVERLKTEAAKQGGQGSYAWIARDLCDKAATAITELEARVEELEGLARKAIDTLESNAALLAKLGGSNEG